jgi:hypothetical protein
MLRKRVMRDTLSTRLREWSKISIYSLHFVKNPSFMKLYNTVSKLDDKQWLYDPSVSSLIGIWNIITHAEV